MWEMDEERGPEKAYTYKLMGRKKEDKKRGGKECLCDMIATGLQSLNAQYRARW